MKWTSNRRTAAALVTGIAILGAATYLVTRDPRPHAPYHPVDTVKAHQPGGVEPANLAKEPPAKPSVVAEGIVEEETVTRDRYPLTASFSYTVNGFLHDSPDYVGLGKELRRILVEHPLEEEDVRVGKQKTSFSIKEATYSLSGAYHHDTEGYDFRLSLDEFPLLPGAGNPSIDVQLFTERGEVRALFGSLMFVPTRRDYFEHLASPAFYRFHVHNDEFLSVGVAYRGSAWVPLEEPSRRVFIDPGSLEDYREINRLLQRRLSELYEDDRE